MEPITFSEMKLDTMYRVVAEKGGTFRVGDHVWIDSGAPELVNCVEAQGFLEIDECRKELSELELEPSPDWVVTTKPGGGSRAYKPTQEQLEFWKNYLEL